ncbi:hypothetical protein VZT92_018087 [Zoarces viviparus]|uniref:Uncharacterized protein n=1 Tax=Zoarces viviparus TaxID=48416 RepID=A0AAW1EPI6_ZOAVI
MYWHRDSISGLQIPQSFAPVTDVTRRPRRPSASSEQCAFSNKRLISKQVGRFVDDGIFLGRYHRRQLAVMTPLLLSVGGRGRGRR